MIDHYRFEAKIPTCNQIEKVNDVVKGRLSTKQTNITRLVTKVSFKIKKIDKSLSFIKRLFKCRFIIEKQIGQLKNFKALDNIRNNQAGHIQIDYRIACAMLNFTHKPCCPDGKNALQIAKKIRKQTDINENVLQFLINKRLDTKDLERIKIDNINDFPKLKKKRIRNSILFGSYQLKQSRSYLKELINNGIAYNVTSHFIKKITNQYIKTKLSGNDHKIVAIEIASRHKRSEIKKKDKETDEKNTTTAPYKLSERFKTTYKVFVFYQSNQNNSNGIKGI